LRREDLPELHYIAHFDNLASICRSGLLSHERAKKVEHRSVAMEEIQDRRAHKSVPGGRALHAYVNLYFYARNPMLYKRQGVHADLGVLRISPTVLDLPGVVITDRNAASDYARFYPSPRGLANVEGDLIFAEYWTHPDDQIEEWRHKSIMCAEVLAPDRVGPEHILGGYVSNIDSRDRLHGLMREAGVDLPLTVDQHLFFR
jgi:ssDNA thymidine ADP-ribosyltransferase, DarT